MPRRSTRTDKTIYQISREKAGLTREAAGLEMEFISDDRIENIETKVKIRASRRFWFTSYIKEPVHMFRLTSWNNVI